MHVTSMHGDIGGSITLLRHLSERQAEEAFAAVPHQAVPGRRANGDFQYLRAYSDVIEDSDTVRPKVDAGPQSVELRCLFVDVNVIAGALKERCTSGPSQSRTYDRDPGLLGDVHRTPKSVVVCMAGKL